MALSAVNGQVAVKNAALGELNSQSGKEYLTTGQSGVEQTASENSTIPGEDPKWIGSTYLDFRTISWWQSVALTAVAIGLFYLAIKNKWIRV
jgi:hypothetical protein